MRQIILFFTLLIASATCAQEILGQEHWPDGSLRATRYSDGSRIHFITYHENGKVKEMRTFRRGRRDGMWKQYNDTGALITQASFLNGERNGTWEFRTDGDRPMGRLSHAHGTLAHGEQFDLQGALVAQRDY